MGVNHQGNIALGNVGGRHPAFFVFEDTTMSTKQAERTKAADQIMRLLTLLEPTGSAQDDRVRNQLIAEAEALYVPIFKTAL